MQRTFEDYPSGDAGDAIARIIDTLCATEDACYPKAASGEGGGGKPSSSVPKGDSDAIATLADMVNTLNVARSRVASKLDKLIARQSRKRRTRSCIEVQACVVGDKTPCGLPEKCHLAQASAIAQAMPKDAVAITLSKTAEERSEAAKKAIGSRWSRYGNDHRN